MTPPARPDPVAALAAELIEEGLLTAWTDAPGDKELKGYNRQAVSRIVAQMAEAGYVLVNADMLLAAIPDDLSYWEDRIFHGGSKAELAAAILAALKGPTRPSSEKEGPA